MIFLTYETGKNPMLTNSINKHSDCFQSLAFNKHAAVNILVPSLFLHFASISLGSIPGSEIAGSKGTCMLSGRYCQIATYRGCAVLYCYPFLHSFTNREVLDSLLIKIS